MAAVLLVTDACHGPEKTAEVAECAEQVSLSAFCACSCGHTSSRVVLELAKSFTSAPDLYHSKTTRHKPNSRPNDDVNGWNRRPSRADLDRADFGDAQS